MAFDAILFYWFALWLVVASLAMVFMRNSVHSILMLILAFFSAACLWMLLEAEFLSVILVLVYVGALMVLLLFVVMMLNIKQATDRAKFTRYLPLGLVVGAVLISEIVLVLGIPQFGLDVVPAPSKHGAEYSNITELALLIYTEYVYLFELAAVLLLVAIIAAITLIQRHQLRRKTQQVGQQTNVKASDRLTMVSSGFAGGDKGEKRGN